MRRSTAPRATRPARRSQGRWDDKLPTEPGGYNGYQGLFGAKYIAPAIGGGPNVFHNGYQVTDANGNLVDLDQHTLTEPFSGTPGFTGFSPTASQTLAVMADMQEAGIPVTYGYISDLHERKVNTSNCTTVPANAVPSGRPLGPGDSCYTTNAQNYDSAFARFFQRLEADGITPKNTLFVISAEENDQFAGANVGRATAPTPAGCDGVTVACNYATGQIGELQANIKGLLSTTPSASTQFDIEPQGASIYVHGNPAANDATVRQLERDTAAMTNPHDPFSGVDNEKIVALPGRCARAAGTAHADIRPAADADLHALPEAGLLLRHDRHRRLRRSTSGSIPASPTTTATTARTSTSPGSASPAREPR